MLNLKDTLLSNSKANYKSWSHTTCKTSTCKKKLSYFSFEVLNFRCQWVDFAGVRVLLLHNDISWPLFAVKITHTQHGTGLAGVHTHRIDLKPMGRTLKCTKVLKVAFPLCPYLVYWSIEDIKVSSKKHWLVVLCSAAVCREFYVTSLSYPSFTSCHHCC